MREVEAVLHKHYHNPDIEAARLILAAAAAHAFKTHVPVWVLAIAPPGSAKTDLLESLRGLPKSYFPDEITPKTFLSGKIDQPGCKRLRPAGLLHRIGSDGILVASDFSTYTADPRNFKVILPQLRRIYDGNYCREFGSDENPEEREWHGRLTIFAGAVPDIDRHYSLFQKLGERFVRVRWPRPAGVDAALRAMSHTDQVAAELRAAVHGLLMPILVVPQPEVFVPSETQLRIANLTELVALGRSHVERDRYKREIVAIPVVEGNTRLPMQLVQLARGSALLDGRTAVMEADYTLVCRAALDSLPLAALLA